MNLGAAEDRLVESESARITAALRSFHGTEVPCQVALLHSGFDAPPLATFTCLLSVDERTRLNAAPADRLRLWDPASWEHVNFLPSEPGPEVYELAMHLADVLEPDAGVADPVVRILQNIARATTTRARGESGLVSDDFVCWAADHDDDPGAGFRACADTETLRRYEREGWLPSADERGWADELLPDYLDQNR